MIGRHAAADPAVRALIGWPPRRAHRRAAGRAGPARRRTSSTSCAGLPTLQVVRPRQRQAGRSRRITDELPPRDHGARCGSRSSPRSCWSWSATLSRRPGRGRARPAARRRRPRPRRRRCWSCCSPPRPTCRCARSRRPVPRQRRRRRRGRGASSTCWIFLRTRNDARRPRSRPPLAARRGDPAGGAGRLPASRPRPSGLRRRVRSTLRPAGASPSPGRSGAGKTSLLSRPPPASSTPSDGRVVCLCPGSTPARGRPGEPGRAQLAWLPQRPRLASGTRLREALAAGEPGDGRPARARRSEAERRRRHRRRAAGRAPRPPSSTSERRSRPGEIRRLALARALAAHKPCSCCSTSRRRTSTRWQRRPSSPRPSPHCLETAPSSSLDPRRARLLAVVDRVPDPSPPVPRSSRRSP